MTLLQGRLADRDAWSAGTTRFEDFWRRVGITKAAAAARLADLVDAGLLARRPYQERGQRSRDEYVLTDAGVDFMPVVWAMFEWGRRHLPTRSALRLAHDGCGAEATVEIRCDKGHQVPADELVMRVGKRNNG
jgi:DNA-binding HxlR family transcriptional regulator